MPRPRSPRRHSRSPRRQRHRSPSPRSRSRSRSRGRANRSPPARRYSRDTPPAKSTRRRSLTPQPKQTSYGGRRSRSYSPDNRGRSHSPVYQEQRVSGRSSPRNYRDQSPEYYQKPKDSQMPTYVVVNRDRSYSPDRRQGQYDDRRDAPRDLDARLREMEARSPEVSKPREYAKDDYSRNSTKDSYKVTTSYDKNRQSREYRRDEKSPERYRESKKGKVSRDYEEPAPRKDSYNDDYQASGRSYSPPPRRESREQKRNGTTTERRRSKDDKYKHSSPDRYRSPEQDRRDSRQDRQGSGHRDEDKYAEKKERSGGSRSSHGNHSNRDGYDSSQKSHRKRKDSTSNDKKHQDRDSERDRTTTFDPKLVIVPRRKDEGRGGIFNRPEIMMRPVTDDPDNQPMPFEEKRVVAVMPGKPLPGPALSDRDLHRDYLELLARKDFEVRKDKYRDLSLGAPTTLSSRFQGASSLDLLATLENFEISRAKNIERELELRREMDLLRERSPLRLSDIQTDLEERIQVMERKVEPKNPRDLRHDLESRRKQLKSGRTDTAASPRRAVLKKSEKESKLRMTSADQRRPIRERLGMSPGKRERRDSIRERLGSSPGKRDRRDRREVEEHELPDFKKEVEELQKQQWIEDPKSVPKGPGYFEHDDREDEVAFGLSSRGRTVGIRGRGRGIGFRGRGTGFLRGRGIGFRGSFRGARGGFRGMGRGRGTFRGRSSPQWKHDKFESDGKEKKGDREEKGGSSKGRTSKKDSSSHGNHRSDDRHSSRTEDRKSSKDSRDRRPDRSRDSTSSRSRVHSRDTRKDRR